jgi:hypothetical protein
MSNIEKLLAAVLAELKKFTGRMPGADAPGALKRSLAAKKMGISISKLNWRIRVGLTQTCADPHMIPMSEILRFTASQDAETGLEPAADARTIMSIPHRRRSMAKQSEDLKAVIRADNAAARKKKR